MLSEEAMTRGLNCLSLFAERLQGFSCQRLYSWYPYAASGAEMPLTFETRGKVHSLPIPIISGNEEARLILWAWNIPNRKKVANSVIDIGGGSTELVIGENFEPTSR
ncbi:hypothetical protein ACNKHM_20865 [Shigella sonnei]